MDSISKNVFIDTQYTGVTLGVISHSQGLIHIDAPPSPEDGRSWRASLMGLGGGPDRILVTLDSHPDRTIGLRVMECSIIAHEETTNIIRNRPNIFKAQSHETGANWETISGGLTGIRWVKPETTFTHSISLQWDDTLVQIESHPGPNPGAIWVVLPNEKIVFVGDAVLKNKPPFLAKADLTAWLETLNTLQSKPYRDYKVIGGRDGSITTGVIEHQLEFIKDAQKRMDKISKRKQKPGIVETLVQPLLSQFKIPAIRRKLYTQRLTYGLHHYYAYHYYPGHKN